MPEELNVVIVGGGHAGLNLALNIQEEGKRSYIVLERETIFTKWKTTRWDAFKLNTPQHFSRLHGQKDNLPDCKLGTPLQDQINAWEEHVRAARISVRENCKVISVSRREDGKFVTEVECEDGTDTKSYVSTNLACCCGNYDHTKIPTFADKLDKSIAQIPLSAYKNPNQLPENGSVLVVGGGQSGHQVADDLNGAGKKVFLCSSLVPGSVRSHRGEDIFYWMERIGMSAMTKDSLKAMPEQLGMAFRYGRIPVTGSTKPLSPFDLHRRGVTILGSASDVSEDGATVSLKDNRPENLGVMLGSYGQLPQQIEEYIKNNKLEDKYPTPIEKESEWEPVPELLDGPGPDKLNLKDENVSAVVFATGWKADFSWIKIPEVVAAFDPVNHLPDSLKSPAMDGFFFSGFHWLNTLQSANIVGMDVDHAEIMKMLK